MTEHSAFGYSAVSTFEQCPYRYKLTYIDHLKTIPSDDPANALIVGTALHRAVETDVDTAIQEYFDTYPIITDQHAIEEIKLRYWVPKVKDMIPDDAIHETIIRDENFIGTIDLLVPNDEGTLDLYDFKYTNNWLRYMDSRQLHLYKYYFEKTTGKHIRKLGFIFVPKVNIKQKKTETDLEFKQRLARDMDKQLISVKYIEYDPNKVIEHLEATQRIMKTREFKKQPSRLCDWCEYKKFCLEGEMIDMLPSTQRVEINSTKYKKIWIYGAPFSGKTTVVDSAPTPLNLNTDGNVKNVTMARLPIKDTVEGRQKKLAWEVFKEAIDDLEAGSEFETIVVDLLEDTYESCRLYMYKQMGITHESDDSFRAWDKVRTEFLSTLRRLMNLDYNIVLISHEDMSKDITKRTGDKVTAIKPNIQDKIANKVAGMVDIVIRAIKEDDNYILSTKTSNVIFGGGRLQNMKSKEVPSSWEAIEAMYNGSTSQREPISEVVSEQKAQEPKQKQTSTQNESDDVVNLVDVEIIEDETPRRRTRRKRTE